VGLFLYSKRLIIGVVAAYHLVASPPVVIKYVDGVFQYDWTEKVSLDHLRRALLPTAILFADGDQDERRTMWVIGQICLWRGL
jgi:hypothetical protein